MKEIPKQYHPKEIEDKWYKYWQEKGYFHSQPDNRKPFSIVIPPPNVTGVLHMGHALNNILQDIVIRYKKLTGKNTCWVPGTDHGGIATQNVVEKEIYKKEKLTRHDIGRDEFLEKMKTWCEATGSSILNQLKKLGSSCDWERERFTMDEQCSRAVKEAFKKLFDDGLIYRGERMINWCIRCGTALADIEVEFEEEKGKLWYIKYPIKDSKEYVVVATTRPETMLGDTAVAVNPDDTRYKHLVGKKVILPLVGREIPIIADERVDSSFGTGAVKVTPAHDPADFEMAEDHKLKKLNIITNDGKITEDILIDSKKQDELIKYIGKEIKECSDQIVADLIEQKYLDPDKIEGYKHNVGKCYRCSTKVQPLIRLQWFLESNKLADMALEALEKKRPKFYPEQWKKPYQNWLENLKDWCLSRQIWWGHRIPAWYCGKCDQDNLFFSLKPDKVGYLKNKDSLGITIPNLMPFGEYRLLKAGGLSYEQVVDEKNRLAMIVFESARPIVSDDIPEKCPICSSHELFQDPDVLDTWFSSALWPFSVFGWPEETADLKYYYPTSVLVTGYEILYLWVARMVMMGLYFRKEIPFDSVYIHGIVRDKSGKKMSKSLGNVIDPLLIIDQYGTDGLRFTMAYNSTPGRDLQLGEDSFVFGRNFTNKIWNLFRFLTMNLEGYKKEEWKEKELPPSCVWIVNQFDKYLEEVEKSMGNYDISSYAQKTFEFFWFTFCDWYVEISKIYLNDPKTKSMAQNIFLDIFQKMLVIMHPVFCHLSEEIWQYLKECSQLSESIMEAEWPKTFKLNRTEEVMENVIKAVEGIRTIRGELRIAPNDRIKAYVSGKDAEKLKVVENYISFLAGTKELILKESIERPKDTFAWVNGNFEIFVAMEGIDREKEKERLKKEMEKLDFEISKLKKNLENPNFLKGAPAEIIGKMKEKITSFQDKQQKISKNLLFF